VSISCTCSTQPQLVVSFLTARTGRQNGNGNFKVFSQSFLKSKQKLKRFCFPKCCEAILGYWFFLVLQLILVVLYMIQVQSHPALKSFLACVRNLGRAVVETSSNTECLRTIFAQTLEFLSTGLAKLYPLLFAKWFLCLSCFAFTFL